MSGSKSARFLVAGFLVLLLNSSYLAAYDDPTAFYFANVGLHLLLGVILALWFLVFVVRRLKQLSLTFLVGAAFAGAGALMGGFIMIFGATRQYRWALYTHIVFSVVGSI